MSIKDDILTNPDCYHLMWVNNGHPDYDCPNPVPDLKSLAKSHSDLIGIVKDYLYHHIPCDSDEAKAEIDRVTALLIEAEKL